MKSYVQKAGFLHESHGFAIFQNLFKAQQHDNTINHMQLPSLTFVKKCCTIEISG